MFVQHILVEDEELAVSGQTQTLIATPSWRDVNEAILKLDGNRRSTVILSHEQGEERFMSVAGGENGVYVCLAYDECGRESCLQNPKDVPDQIVQVLMGELNVRSLNDCVELEAALLAARTYFESGELDNRLPWREVQ